MSLTHHLQIILVTYCISLQNRLNLMFVTRKYLNSSASLWLQGVLTMSIRCECENSTESYLPLSLFLFSPLCHISSHDTEMCIELFVLRQYQGLQLRRGCWIVASQMSELFILWNNFCFCSSWIEHIFLYKCFCYKSFFFFVRIKTTGTVVQRLQKMLVDF